MFLELSMAIIIIIALIRFTTMSKVDKVFWAIFIALYVIGLGIYMSNNAPTTTGLIINIIWLIISGIVALVASEKIGNREKKSH